MQQRKDVCLKVQPPSTKMYEETVQICSETSFKGILGHTLQASHGILDLWPTCASRSFAQAQKVADENNARCLEKVLCHHTVDSQQRRLFLLKGLQSDERLREVEIIRETVKEPSRNTQELSRRTTFYRFSR